MSNKQNRILWLFNHETLTSFEVPLLRKLGFEVFVPKIYPKTEEWGSGATTWEHDISLTIPHEALTLLNKCDFYSSLPLTAEVLANINSHFAAVFFNHPPRLTQLLKRFSGAVFYRVFGREAPNNYGAFFTPADKRQLLRRREHFFFAQALPYISEIEDRFLTDRAITLPFGIPEHVMQKTNSWRGGNRKLLFVCPRISTSPYYKNIYAAFKENFSDVPHLIAGKQFQRSQDTAILGNLPRDKYDAVLTASEVLFYHSEEPRHIHYHPLEAMVFGVPMIYMHKGVLGRRADQKLPGACDTINKAKEKVLQVLRGDIAFTNEVLESQKSLLAKLYSPVHCERAWEKLPELIRKALR